MYIVVPFVVVVVIKITASAAAKIDKLHAELMRLPLPYGSGLPDSQQ